MVTPANIFLPMTDMLFMARPSNKHKRGSTSCKYRYEVTGHSFLYGLLYEVAICSVALSVNQIDAIRKSGLESALGIDPKDNLAARWEMIKKY